MHDEMGDYLERSYGYDEDPHTPERWGKFKMMVEYLITQAVNDEGEDNEGGNWAIGENGKVLIGHAILWLFVSGNVNFAARCLLFAKAHQPKVFLVKNKQGRTLLDIVIRHCASCLYGGHRSHIVHVIVQEDPDACLQRGRDGRLPIHLALRMRKKFLFDLVFNAATSVANQKCPKTHLYPYQLAAVQYTDSNTPDDEAPDWSGEEDEDDDYFDVAEELLSRIYELLRQSPNLVGDGISPDCRMLSHPESIAIAREELELTHVRDRHFQIERECAAQHRSIERERAAKVNERKRKHGSSSQAT